MTRLITVQRVHELQRTAAQFGPLGGGEREHGCVDSAIFSAVNTLMYLQETEDVEIIDPLRLAAMVLRNLATKQCYTDGNKRTAWLVALEILAVGAHATISAPQEEAADFVLSVAARELSWEDAAEWFARRLIALS